MKLSTMLWIVLVTLVLTASLSQLILSYYLLNHWANFWIASLSKAGLNRIVAEMSTMKDFFLAKLLRQGIILLGIWLVVGIGISALAIKKIRHPFSSLLKYVQSTQQGSDSIDSLLKEPKGIKEAEILGKRFYDLLKELHRQELYNRIGFGHRMARIIGHEIKNLLSPIRIEAEKENTDKNLILKKIHQIEQVINKFKNMTDLPHPKFEEIEIFKFLQAEGLTPHSRTSEKISIVTDPIYLRQIINNIVENFRMAQVEFPAVSIERKENCIILKFEGPQKAKSKGWGIGMILSHEIAKLIGVSISEEAAQDLYRVIVIIPYRV